VLSVLFPIMPDGAVPTVTALPGEIGAKVATANRTDWVFLPEHRTAATVDGIEFDGLAGSFSQRGTVNHYMVERNTRLTAKGLGLHCNFPVDLLVNTNLIEGSVASRDAVPVLTLSGPTALRARSVTIGAITTPLKADANGTVTVRFPLGDTRFEIALG
jgi:hypothetical protein